jgi:hypothetical protein
MMKNKTISADTAAHYSLLLLAIVLVFVLSGCASTGNVDRKYNVSAHNNTGLLLFSVSHDKDERTLGRGGANIYFSVTFHSDDTTDTIPRAVSNDLGALMPTSQFDNVWGTLYVREFPAGRYELFTWELIQNTGVSISSFTPKQLPQPISFEVRPGSVTYIGNIHGFLLWRKNIFGMDLVDGVIPKIMNEADRDINIILKDYPQLNGLVITTPLRTGAWLTKPTD